MSIAEQIGVPAWELDDAPAAWIDWYRLVSAAQGTVRREKQGDQPGQFGPATQT